MQDLKAKLEKLLTEAEDSDLICKLATDVFARLTTDLRGLAKDIQAMIAGREPDESSFDQCYLMHRRRTLFRPTIDVVNRDFFAGSVPVSAGEPTAALISVQLPIGQTRGVWYALDQH